MILYVSPEELQRFAGKGGEEAAVQVIPSLEQWASTGHARKAVWHAGQVFRAAAQMPPAGLRDFLAIAVYFASLTIWTYSNLCPSSSRNGSERPKSRLSHLQDTTSVAIVDGPGKPPHIPLVLLKSPSNFDTFEVVFERAALTVV
tara:strand:- start:36 stop:470 length:435 start_codon:yes stop_codon:yes gene_type:complete